MDAGELFHVEAPGLSDVTIIKCVSLWEPWASLMAVGAKRNETRSWPTSYRGPILICASKKRIPELPELLNLPAFKRGLSPLRQPGDRIVKDLLGRLSFGMAVAVVDLVDCVRAESVESFPFDEREFGDYTPGRWAWITKSVRRVEPFPITGHQGIWNEAIEERRLAPKETPHA